MTLEKLLEALADERSLMHTPAHRRYVDGYVAQLRTYPNGSGYTASGLCYYTQAQLGYDFWGALLAAKSPTATKWQRRRDKGLEASGPTKARIAMCQALIAELDAMLAESSQ